MIKTGNNVDGRVVLAVILIAAIALRLAFRTGYFGSDELTYTHEALLISQGIWRPSDYIGSVRLGVNLPVGFFLWLFGATELAANLWSLLCSIGEVTLVFLLARRLWGLEVATVSAMLLAFTPLHAYLGGNVLADAPLGFFITLTFYSQFRGDIDASWRWYLLSGLSAGFVWWIKSAVAPIFVLVFLLFLIRERRVAPKWFIMGAGFLAMLTINSLIFAIMQGDFWHLFRMTFSSGVANYVLQLQMRTEPHFYLGYLFYDIRHTWLLGPLALLGVYAWARSSRTDLNLTNVVIWGVGLIGMFSLFFVSISPIVLIAKQVNYMAIFLAPLALLGGYAIARLPFAARVGTLAAIVAIGVVGTALEQLNVSSFVANSKSAYRFASETPERPVYGMTNAVRYVMHQGIFAPSHHSPAQIRHIKLLDQEVAQLAGHAPDESGFLAYVILDLHTADWGGNGSYTSQRAIPGCWRYHSTLQPTNAGAGYTLVALITRAASGMVSGLPYTGVLLAKLDGLLTPKPAHVYGIPPACVHAAAYA